MKYVNLILILLVAFLAASSGVAKVMLIPMDVEFYGKYGFSNPALIGFGCIQLIGSLLLILPKMRRLGAIMIGASFLLSLALLIMEGNIPVAAVTLICLVALGYIAKQARTLK